MRNYKDFQKNNFVYRENGVEIFLKKKGEFLLGKLFLFDN